MGVLGITFPQGPELIVIIAVLVLLFGAKKLPELGSSVGKSIKNFKKGVEEAEADETDDAGDTGETSRASQDNA